MKKLLRILNTITLISTASTSVVACVTKKEEPAPPAQKINLDSLQDNASVTLKKTNKTVNDYQKALITELQKQVAFSSLQLTDVDITKDDGTALQDNDIKTDDISTKVKAKTASLNFTGEKIITVKTNIVQVNLNDLQDSANMILQKTNKTVNDYQKALITELQKQVAFSSLQLTDVNITKDDGTALQNNDIKTDNINTKIKAKTASPNFTGEKIITVKTTVIDKTEVAKFPAEVESLAFKNNDLYAGCKSGFIYKIDVSAPTPTEVEIINLGIWIETLVFKDNDLYAGCKWYEYL